MTLSVRQLIEQLERFPDYYPVVVETIVGGDIGTDVVDVEEVKVGGHHTAYVELIPDPSDNYGTRDLIDNGIAVHYARDQAELLGTGFVRYTRTPDGDIVVDHVDATLVTIHDRPRVADKPDSQPSRET